MTINVLGEEVEPTSQKEFASFVFGYLNCVSEMIAMTIRDIDKQTPNEKAKDFVSKLGATYMASVSQGVAKQMNLPSDVFSKYMTKEIHDACKIIAQEAGKNLDTLEGKLSKMKEHNESYQRERNEWEDNHGH